MTVSRDEVRTRNVPDNLTYNIIIVVKAKLLDVSIWPICKVLPESKDMDQQCGILGLQESWPWSRAMFAQSILHGSLICHICGFVHTKGWWDIPLLPMRELTCDSTLSQKWGNSPRADNLWFVPEFTDKRLELFWLSTLILKNKCRRWRYQTAVIGPIAELFHNSKIYRPLFQINFLMNVPTIISNHDHNQVSFSADELSRWIYTSDEPQGSEITEKVLKSWGDSRTRITDYRLHARMPRAAPLRLVKTTPFTTRSDDDLNYI
jgi:hypothetical protein